MGSDAIVLFRTSLWPVVKRMLIWIFAPRAVGRQFAALLMCIVLRRTLHFSRKLRRRCYRAIAVRVSSRARQLEDLRKRRRTCKEYVDFQRLGEQMDTLQGLDRWKDDEENNPFYNSDLVRERTENYKKMRAEGDVEGTMYALRGELLRKHFGITNPALFAVTYSGTKHLVEQYVKTVVEAIAWVASEHRRVEVRQCYSQESLGEDGISSLDQAISGEISSMSVKEKLASFLEMKQSFGNSALLLSGGAALGMYHFGVVKALHKEGVLPKIIGGTSAGSIVCGTICVRTDEELMQMWLENYDWERGFDLTFFDVPNFVRFIRKGGSGLYSSEFLKECMMKNVGELTFMEAYDRTGRVCNISLSGHSGSTKYPMLCNYLTTPNVLIYSAIVASCSLPGIFEPITLEAKGRPGPDGKRKIIPYIQAGLKWLDGSMQSDLPMSRLSELFNVNYFIVSQVNPQARLLTGQGVGSPTGPIFFIAQFLRHQLKQTLLSFSSLLLRTSGRVSPWFRPVGFTPVGLIVQEYEGDVTIFNGAGMTEAFNLLNNGSNMILRSFTKESEWETWWYMNLIQNSCAIEVAMNEVIEDLQAQLSGTAPEISVSEPVSLMQSATKSRRPSILHSESFVLPDYTESEMSIRAFTAPETKLPQVESASVRHYRSNAAGLKAHSSKDFLKQGLYCSRRSASCASLVDAAFGSCEDVGRLWSNDSSKAAGTT